MTTTTQKFLGISGIPWRVRRSLDSSDNSCACSLRCQVLLCPLALSRSRWGREPEPFAQSDVQLAASSEHCTLRRVHLMNHSTSSSALDFASCPPASHSGQEAVGVALCCCCCYVTLTDADEVVLVLPLVEVMRDNERPVSLRPLKLIETVSCESWPSALQSHHPDGWGHHQAR